jgi:hypothetical protein
VSGPRYLLHLPSGQEVVERLERRPGEGGWAGTAVREDPATGTVLGRVELRVDAAGTTTRLHAEARGWVVRGGCVGDAVLWRRGADEGEAVAAGFSGTSPVYALALLDRLRLEVGGSRRLRLVELGDPVLAPRLVAQAWARPAGERWVVDDLDTGERRALEVRDGVVVAGTGLTLTRT